MKIFNEKEIKELVSHPRMYAKGLRYYHVDAVHDLNYDTLSRVITAKVDEEVNRDVSIQLSSGEISGFHCTCDNFQRYSGACEHVVAVLKQCNETYNNIRKDSSLPELLKNHDHGDDPAAKVINAFRRQELSQNERKDIQIEVYMQFRREQGLHAKQSLRAELFLKIGYENQMYVLKSFDSFFEALYNHLPLPLGKRFTFDPTLHKLPQAYEELIDVIYNIYKWDKEHKRIKNKKVLLDGDLCGQVLDACSDIPLLVTHLDGTQTQTRIYTSRLPLTTLIKEEGKRLVMQLKNLEQYYFITEDAGYIYYHQRIFKVDKEARVYFRLLYEESYKDSGRMVFTGGQRDAFVSHILPVLKEQTTVEMDESIEDKIIQVSLDALLVLEWQPNQLGVQLNFNYNDHRFNGLTDTLKKSGNEAIILRDVKREGQIKSLLSPYMQYLDINGGLYVDDEESIYDFLFDVLPELSRYCDIKYLGDFKDKILVYQPSIKTGASLSKKINYFEYTFSIEGIDPSEFSALRARVKENKRYYQAKDGSILNLEDVTLQDFMFFMDQLKLKDEDFEEGSVDLPKYQAFMLNDYLKKDEQLHFRRSHEFKDYVDGLLHPEDMDYAVPEKLDGILRDYQVIGFKWMKALSEYRLGGILADDMGLGKTLQVITFLISEYDKNPKPALVIVPTSLLYNWKDEIRKFAPELRVSLVTGDKVTRKDIINDISDEHIVLSTYALVRNDVDLYQAKSFACCILDEAQYIKNPNALITKAVKDIKADYYLALTGTPIENSLQELWSIFDFLMPGYLYTHNYFAAKYERPIAKMQDEKAAKVLARHIQPFIMRRMKQDVLTELPPKIEDIKSCQLTREQKKLYVSFLEKTKNEIYKVIEDTGFDKGKLKILTLLTRLRQICCHPSLFVEDYEGDSGKLELLKELVTEAVAGNHRMLIFSQFTSMLKIIRSNLEEMGISYQYLDGSVKSAERINRVNAFNNGEGHVFLISLKAGGTGLNLTSADMVIHYDPWWNPAVEEQATDRAYRIGQKNSVQVIRLLTKGTIEEKIFQLKEAKRHLVEQVMEPTNANGVMSQLSKEELMHLIEDMDFE